MSALDEYLYEESYQSTEESGPFIKKEVVYVNDQQNGSYISQIQFDLSSLSNSFKWQSWKEAIIEIPLVVIVENNYLRGLKSIIKPD